MFKSVLDSIEPYLISLNGKKVDSHYEMCITIDMLPYVTFLVSHVKYGRHIIGIISLLPSAGSVSVVTLLLSDQ